MGRKEEGEEGMGQEGRKEGWARKEGRRVGKEGIVHVEG